MRRKALWLACGAALLAVALTAPTQAQIRAGLVNLASMVTGVLPGANGGTGVANTSKTITLGGNLTTSGANAVTFTTSGTTGVTLPTSGTLAVVGNPLSQFAATTSSQLLGVLSDETGTGTAVFGTDPTFLGAPNINSTGSNTKIQLNASNASAPGIRFVASGVIDWQTGTTSLNGTDGMFLASESTGVLSQYNGVGNAMVYRIYAGRTSSTDYSTRLAIAPTAGSIGFTAESAGATASSNIDMVWTPKGAGTVNVASALKIGGNLVYSTATPTVTSGFGTTPAIAGRASAFKVTTGSGGASSGVVGFNATFAAAPSCTANNETTSSDVRATPTATQVTLTGTFTASDVLSVVCLGF